MQRRKVNDYNIRSQKVSDKNSRACLIKTCLENWDDVIMLVNNIKTKAKTYFLWKP